jgi:hypothetical protein
MFILGKLVFQSYVPAKFEIGMLFLRKVSMFKLKTLIEHYEVFELKEIPRDKESFILVNGWPVLPFIYSITANPDAFADILAKPEQIGWWDDGPESDELRDIDIKDYNYILENEDGIIEIEVDLIKSVNSIEDDGSTEEEEIVTPILYMDKVTIRIPTDEEKYDEEDENDYDTDTDNYEDWDDMDDEPEEELDNI